MRTRRRACRRCCRELWRAAKRDRAFKGSRRAKPQRGETLKPVVCGCGGLCRTGGRRARYFFSNAQDISSRSGRPFSFHVLASVACATQTCYSPQSLPND
jgi:hypothetical protein